MAVPRKDDPTGGYSSRAYFVPVLWILALVAVYYVLADWQAVPGLIASTLAAIH